MKLKKMYDSIIDETVYYQVLDNGLPVYIMPKKGFRKKYVSFATSYGSVDNQFRDFESSEIVTVPDGIAHFLEHKMFDDAKMNVFDRFASYGANVNAYTSYTMTNYFFDTADNFDQCLNLLLDFVQTLYLTEESVEKEKKIIAQEILMYEDDPDWIGYLTLLQALFHQHPVREDIAGTVDSVYQTKKEQIEQCYKTFYHPGNMILFVAGDLDPEQVLETVRQNQVKKDYEFHPPVEHILQEEPEEVFKRRVENEMAVSRPICNIGFKERKTGIGGDALLKRDLVTNILIQILFGKSSELYQNLYEQGIIGDNFSASYTGDLGYGMTVLGGHTDDTDRFYNALINGLKAKKGNITGDELERIRRKMIGDYISTFDSLRAIGQNFTSYYFNKMNIFHELKLLNQITLEDLEQRVDQHFRLDNHAVSIVNPQK